MEILVFCFLLFIGILIYQNGLFGILLSAIVIIIGGMLLSALSTREGKYGAITGIFLGLFRNR